MTGWDQFIFTHLLGSQLYTLCLNCTTIVPTTVEIVLLLSVLYDYCLYCTTIYTVLLLSALYYYCL